MARGFAFAHSEVADVADHKVAHGFDNVLFTFGRLGKRRAGGRERRHHAADIRAPDIVLAIHVTGVGLRLGMGFRHMEPLQKGLHGDLPVAGHNLGNMGRQPALLKWPGRKMLGHDAEILGQRCAIRVHVDEDKAAPCVEPGLRQIEILFVDMRKVPVTGDFFQRTIKVPGEAVKRTAQLRHIA